MSINPMADLYTQQDQPRDILQRDWIAYVKNDLGQEQWFTAYCSLRGSWGTAVCFCALIPNAMVAKALANESWDLRIGHGLPGCSVSGYGSDAQIVTYHRFGDDGIEPLVIKRDFDGIKDPYAEVSEEFRLFHDLYYDAARNAHVRIDEAGNEEDIILVEPKRVKIKLKQIKQFLAIKGMHLAAYFSIDRFSTQTLQELGLGDNSTYTRFGNLGYRFMAYAPSYSSKNHRTFTRLEGKKLIPPMAKEKCGIWPYECDDDEIYDEFIIGTDGDGEPIYHTCDPETLANYFGKNPDAPHYLTPVFFRREVLGKYYARPDRYSVEDGYLRCAGLWGLQLDNDHPDHIVVYLGDLGRDLPAGERSYWKSFNITPNGKISAVAWKRGFLGEFADPESPELVFKRAFRRFGETWSVKAGWSLFDLTEETEPALTALHVPLTRERQEFDQQIMTLAKVLIDCINETELEKLVRPRSGRKSDGIGKLDQYLRISGVPDFQRHIKFLREIDTLRIGAAGKASKGNRTTIDLSGDLRAAFSQILGSATATLEFLEQIPYEHAKSSSPTNPKSRSKSRSKRGHVSEETDIAIITILPEEHQAVTRLIPDRKFAPGFDGEPNLFYWEVGNIHSETYGASYRVVTAYAGTAGTNSGLTVTMETIARWQPRHVLLIGIAGGLQPHVLSKGDVVLSSHIWGYEYGKIEHGFRPRPDLNFGPDMALLNCAVGFSSCKPDWAKSIETSCPETTDFPKVVAGPVASGDKVIDDVGDPFFKSVLHAWPKLYAVEMEGVGAGAAIKLARDKGRAVGFLMVRGISDMPPDFTSGPQPSSQTAQRDAWKKYASASAATFAIQFIRDAWPVGPRGVR
jgi:nucleoside phosphorylase